MPKEKKQKIRKLLDEKLPYFSSLTASAKVEFLRRVILFEHTMDFSGKHGFDCTQEVKTIIASGFVQLTFGFRYFLSRHFSEIQVSPLPYDYDGYNVKILGHVDYSKKLIKVSWKSVLEGYALEDDGINVVFHEMGHALEFEHRRWLKLYLSFRNYNLFFSLIAFFLKKRFCFFGEPEYKEWLEWVRKDIVKMRLSEKHFLKQYAAKNRHEYFACALESFFERGQAMKVEMPELYNQLKGLLKQDPLNKSNPRLN